MSGRLAGYYVELRMRKTTNIKMAGAKGAFKSGGEHNANSRPATEDVRFPWKSDRQTRSRREKRRTWLASHTMRRDCFRNRASNKSATPEIRADIPGCYSQCCEVKKQSGRIY